MSAARVIARPASVRSAIALSRRTRPTRRFQSTQSNPGPAAAGGGSGAIAGGVAGGLTAVLVGYGLYRYSGAHNAVSGYQTVKQNYENAIKRATKAAPEPNEAIQWLRQSANSYLGVVPGAKAYIDTTFDELESIHKEHGKEVDKIVKQAYNDLKEVSDKQGASLSGASQAWDIIQRAAKQVGELAKDVGGDVLERNPQLKEKFGGKFDELKRMGDQYGPEAKQKVDETWKQVQDILKEGLGAGSLAKIKSLVEEKVEDVKKLGDQAFDKGLEQAKPYLDKNPKVKEFVEQNKDKLKSANLTELWDKVKSAAQSGDTKELEEFAKQKASQAKEAGGQGLEKYMGMLPGGADVSEKIQQLQKLSDKHGEKFEKLLKEAFEEVRAVLEKKVDEGKKLANEAEKDAKS